MAGNTAGKTGVIKMEINTLKNNELIAGITILSVLKYAKHMEVSKCMLIEPLLSYTKVLSLLRRTNSSIKSIEDLIIKESITFTNFNERYREKLLLSINAILLFSQMGLLALDNEEVIFTGESFNFTDSTLGDNAATRIAASKNAATILAKGDASDLYLSLRVEI